jgi:hypothetical protein
MSRWWWNNFGTITSRLLLSKSFLLSSSYYVCDVWWIIRVSTTNRRCWVNMRCTIYVTLGLLYCLASKGFCQCHRAALDTSSENGISATWKIRQSRVRRRFRTIKLRMKIIGSHYCNYRDDCDLRVIFIQWLLIGTGSTSCDTYISA